MASRLERLFVLLETGSSNVTRHAAAQQLGEVQRLRPHELHRLLNRVYTLLHSSSWETRIAAAQAFEAILKNVPKWDPEPIDSKKDSAVTKEISGRLRFKDFNIEKVLSQGAHLMGSEGNEYDFEDLSISTHDLREKLNKQRQLLNAKLGLDIASKLGMDISDIYSNEDLIPNPSDMNECQIQIPKFSREEPQNDYRKPLDELVPASTTLSLREINRARRKARQLKSTISEDVSCAKDEPEKKKIKIEPTLKEEASLLGEWVPEPDGTWNCDIEWWPLEGWASALAVDLFSSQWEVRHGAATALRELLKIHGDSTGKEKNLSINEMEEIHQIWLEDISLRLLCVLALDRFGDFVSDQVIAPVRETCAQCLGVIATLISSEGISNIASCLTVLSYQTNWEARHGALLGFKYLLAVQQEFQQNMKVFPVVVRALWDSVEDVAAAAAAALTPVTTSLMKNVPSLVPLTVIRIQHLLLVQDELAAACGFYMALLAALLAEPNIDSLLGCKYMPGVIPHLWPYLSHPSSSVRKSALQTLHTLTKCANGVFLQSEEECTDVLVKKDKTEDEISLDNIDVLRKEGIELLNITNIEIDSTLESNVKWNASLLQDALRHIFQRALTEHIQNIKNIIEEVWNNLVYASSLKHLLHATCPLLSSWICLIMQPSKIPFDATQLIQLNNNKKNHMSNDSNIEESLTHTDTSVPFQRLYIAGSETVSSYIKENNIVSTRCMASRMIGLLSCFIVKPAPGVDYSLTEETPIKCYVKVILVYLSSKSALQRFIVGLIISHWAKLDATIKCCPVELSAKLHECLTQPIYFDEVAVLCTRILQDTRDFIAMLRHYKVLPEDDEFNNIFNLEQVLHLTGSYSEILITNSKLKPKIMNTLEERRKCISSSAIQCSQDQNSYNISTLAALAGACATLHSLPDKLNPVIKPLMESIKREENEDLQQLAAKHLAILLDQCIHRDPCPNSKVLNNLCAFLTSDIDYTPRITENVSDSASHSSDEFIKSNDCYSGILALNLQQKYVEKSTSRRCNANNASSKPSNRSLQTDISTEDLFSNEHKLYKQIQIQRRGATFAFISLTIHFGEELPEKLPKLWSFAMQSLLTRYNDDLPISTAEELIACLQVLEVIIPHLHKSLLPKILDSLENLINLLENVYKAVRHMAARCIATLADVESDVVMQTIVNKVIPMLEIIDSETKRQGASETLACIIDKLQLNIVPYIVLLVVPLLGRISDHDESVRLMCTHCFAKLIQLMPLEGAIKERTALSEELRLQKVKDHNFLQQLFDPKSIEDYNVPIPISAQLRCYQQAGINWLAFLNRYKLHGILCDDMGLGKTIQSICIIAGDHFYREQSYKKQSSLDNAPLPSLVICPPTLTGHWVYEVNKFLPNKFLKPLHYTGPPIEREKLKICVKDYNLIIASYDIVRKDIDFFGAIRWNYCVLDEGHIVKNGKTKASKAIKTIIANHRLILSGTPIQNNVLELWSLFDFLMPGFLGTERQFTAKFSKPILAARDPRATSQHQEAGALAMEALHRQVLPFILRRVKEEVLKELPPKITQDYYCELSSLQKRLYEDFSRIHMPNGIHDDLGNQHHIFQALRYLQNVCNHPKFVLTPEHPEFNNVREELLRENSNLNDIQHSAKLPALKQLLQDCGIGCNSSDANILSQHRALIFCQLKGMLEIIENDLLKPLLPQVSYLRLDGTIPPGQRQSVVQQFNNDPSIDVLLLTTQVGGLGLNLTGADTVIFVEHDWNPMKDLQAMDRAHRIGQKKVVNVYRLITKGTLEEKIMGLQKFKLHTANTVISSENASMETMGTDQLLDLFPGTNVAEKNQDKNNKPGSTGPITMKNVLENLPDLWDDTQYETEYDMGKFVKNISKN